MVGDIADPRLEPYRDVRDRDLRGRSDFMAEGAVVLGNAAGASRHRFHSLLVAEPRLAGLSGILERLPPDIPVYVGAPDLLNRVAGFHIHRGILAHGSRAAEPDPGALISQLPRPALLVALFGISNHDNLGGIFRNAAAFGADAVLLDNACCDPLYRKAIRVSVGASLVVPFARARDGEALLAALAASGARAYALATGAAGALHDMRPRSGGMAVLVGSEGRGLPDAALEAADPVRIGMVPGLDSLNAATATGIALHAAAAAMGRI